MEDGAPAVDEHGEDRVSQQQMCLLPVTTESERVLLNRLREVRQEAAILRSQLAAMADREQAQEALIRGLRHDLLEANDRLGRVEGAAPPDSTPTDWTRDFDANRRRVGG